jgi:integrase
LRPAHVQAAYNALSAEGLAARTVRQCHLTLHKALEDALRLELVVRNVSEATTRPRLKTEEMHWYKSDELARLFAASEGDRFHALLVLLGTVGLRLGEALGLKWSDIKMEGQTMTVGRTLQRVRGGGGLIFGEPKSRASGRTIELPKVAISALIAHGDLQKFERNRVGPAWEDHNLVFPSEIGTPIEQGRVFRRWRKVIESAGVPRYRIHDLRHTVATHLLAGGMQPPEVAATLGHSSPALVLQVYGHVIPSSRQRAASIMEQLLASATE